MYTEENIIEIARATHEVNRTYCAALGDFSQVAWEEAPLWQRESAVEGVRAVLDGRAITPEQQHEEWMQHKLNDGWVWGSEKDPVLKTHPCLVSYDQLPPEQQAKDKLFRTVVEGMSKSSRGPRVLVTYQAPHSGSSEAPAPPLAGPPENDAA